MTGHACAHPDREVGGLMLGTVHCDPEDDVVYPVITDTLRANFAVEGRGQLTFTRDTWLELHKVRDLYFKDREILGWYHTHPGLDVFLSGWDVFIHKHFFNRPWQIALVIDPQIDAGGIFVWKEGEILDPDRPHGLFRIADLDYPAPPLGRTRVRITLKDRKS
jgi:proteasome lid subunit RPN8/RPN11